MKYCGTCHAAYPTHINSCPVDNSVLTTTTELVQSMIIRGKYEILEKIATGGMASVYRARHLGFDEVRAIKVVRAWLAEDEEFVRRLRSEAVITRKLKHPNAVHVDDLDQLEDGRPFIVMEYVEGTNLRNLIHNHGPLPLARALDIASQVASALAAAHKLGIIHRDIKPDNIVLVRRPDGGEHVKVLDFGIAKLSGAAAPAKSETRSGLVLCTPEYASPEQARGSSTGQLDGRSDLYSLGVVLYEMLTGALPFKSDTPFGILLAQLNTAPRLVSEVRPDLNLPESVSALLLKCLEKDLARRFQSAEQLLNAIAAIEGETASPSRPTNVISMPLRDVPPPEAPGAGGEYLLSELQEGDSKSVWLYAAVVVVLLVAGVGAWRWSRMHEAANRSQQLAHRVEHALADDPSSAQIRATVSNGVVALSGEAGADAAVSELAAKLARVEGVFRVEKRKVKVVSVSAATPPPAKPAGKLDESASAVNTAAPPLPTSLPVNRAGADNPPATPDERAAAERPVDPRVKELLVRARREHDEGQYDDEIRDYDAVLKLDRNNSEARRGRQKAVRAKQADPGSEL